MGTDKTHIEHIQKQFTQQGEAYKKLDYVKNEAGLEKIVRMSRAEKHHSVLDVACGPGYITMVFGKHCGRVTGVDVTDAFLSAARAEAENRNLDNVTFLKGDVEQLDLPDNSFDRVICRAAFHHFPAPGKVLNEMKRVCKPDGSVIVMDMVASEDTDQAARHNELEKLCDPTHVRALSNSEFKELFADSGLTITFERAGETSYTLEDWIDHGGPDANHERRIREWMAEAVDTDIFGLPVWKEDDGIHFSHRGMAYVLLP